MSPYLTIGVITVATLLAAAANILVVVAACSGVCTGPEVACLLGVACFGDVVAWLCWTGR